MSNKEELQKQTTQLSKITATSLVANILKKHGVNNNKLGNVSRREKLKLRKLIDDLKEQSESLSTTIKK